MSEIAAVAAYGRRAGSARVRLFDWLDRFRVTARESTYLGTASLSATTMLRSPVRIAQAEAALRLLRYQNFRLLILSRRASPLSDGRLEERILTGAERGVYDFDDALWLDTRRPFASSDVWKRSVTAADRVIASNENLASRAREYNAAVTVVPSCVDVSAYPSKRSYSVGTPTAVWIGSPSTEKYLALIAEPLLALHHDIGLRLTVISAGSRSLGSLDQIVDRVNWSASDFAAELLKGDLGLMPLSDDEWSRGKCAYKLLQYGATALPVVASPVGANVEALAAISGSCARSETEWYNAIRECIELSDADRQRQGVIARNAVARHYSYESWSSTWQNAVFGEVIY